MESRIWSEFIHISCSTCISPKGWGILERVSAIIEMKKTLNTPLISLYSLAVVHAFHRLSHVTIFALYQLPVVTTMQDSPKQNFFSAFIIFHSTCCSSRTEVDQKFASGRPNKFVCKQLLWGQVLLLQQRNSMQIEAKIYHLPSWTQGCSCFDPTENNKLAWGNTKISRHLRKLLTILLQQQIFGLSRNN